MKSEHIPILTMVIFLTSISFPLTISYALQPVAEAEINLNPELIETIETLQPNDKLLV